jgi:hypothetical protein
VTDSFNCCLLSTDQAQSLQSTSSRGTLSEVPYLSKRQLSTETRTALRLRQGPNTCQIRTNFVRLYAAVLGRRPAETRRTNLTPHAKIRRTDKEDIKIKISLTYPDLPPTFETLRITVGDDWAHGYLVLHCHKHSPHRNPCDTLHLYGHTCSHSPTTRAAGSSFPRKYTSDPHIRTFMIYPRPECAFRVH